MYKTKLQELCQQRKWKLPEYATRREGPPHQSSFEASVIVNGVSFTSNAPARSSKLAQNDAAFLAFSHFTAPTIHNVNELRSGEETALKENATDVSRSSGAGAAGNVGGLAGNSPLKAAETARIMANEGVAEGSSIAINALNYSGLTTQNAVETIQTQESGVVADMKGNISPGSSKVTCDLNLSELTTPNALVTSQIQESGVFAVAKNDYSSLGSTSQMKEPKTNPTGGNGSVAAAAIDKHTGNSPLKAAETARITANEGVAEGSSIAINALNYSGLTTQNAVETIQTQESGVVADMKGNISPGSSKVICDLNLSELTTPNALVTSQIQESGVFAVAKNDYSSLGSTSQMKEPKTNPTGGNGSVAAATIDKHTDMHHLCKNQLQSYTQKRCISFPVYSCEREGPPHACRFRCKVTVDGNTYGSEEFHSTLNKAELAAAKVALMSLLPNGIDQDESGYKNLLQELVQKRGHRLPTYTTNKSGEDHMPTFVSKVEVGGECFIGQHAKSKKQAESSAARVAYTALKQRDNIIEPALSPSGLKTEETTHAPSPLTSQSDFTGKSNPGPATQQLGSSKRSNLSGNSNENLSCFPPPKRQEIELLSSSNRAYYLAFLQDNYQPSMPVPEKQAEIYPVLDQTSASRSISSSSGTSLSSLNEFGQSATAYASNSSSSSTICSSIEHLVQSSTTCQTGVVVHPRQSSMSYPSGSVLPCSNDDWVAVRFTPDSSN